MFKFFFAITAGLLLNLSTNTWAQSCIPDPSIAMASSPSVINYCAGLPDKTKCEGDDRCNWAILLDGPTPPVGTPIGQCCNPAGNVVSTMVPCPIPSNLNRCCNPAGNPVQPMTASASQCRKKKK